MENENNENESADLSSKLSEEELNKPGKSIEPGTVENTATDDEPKSQNEIENSLNQDVQDFNSFLADQQQAGLELGKKNKGPLHVFWELAKTILIAVAVVFLINTFVFQAYYVSGNSMNPDYHDGDYLLIDKLTSSWNNLVKIFDKKAEEKFNRGDVLIFRPPENPDIFYIKRVVALPGERITLKNGEFKIYNNDYPNGLILKEPYIESQYPTEGEVDEVITPGNLFVVGDNRSPGGSYDSRFWGQLPQKNVSGRAFFRLLPLNDLGVISDPAYSNN